VGESVIARVRIAPVERWCEGLRESAKDYDVKNLGVGREVEIITETMHRWSYCEGHAWKLTLKSSNELREANGQQKHYSQATACEHMLEMD
jgi:hypothetical protein